MLEEGGSLFGGDHRALDDLLRCAPWDGEPCAGIGANQLGGVDRIFQRDGQYRFRLLNCPVRQPLFRQVFQPFVDMARTNFLQGMLSQ